MPPLLKKWGTHVPRIPHQIVPMHVTIRYTELCKYEKAGPNSNCWPLWTTVHIFFTKKYIRTLLPRKNKLFYNSQVEHRDSY